MANMNPEKNMELIRRLYDEVYNKGNMSECDQLISNDCKFMDPAAHNPKSGLNTFKEMENKYKTAFPHKKSNIEDMIAQNNKVVVRWTCQGTHEGQLGDLRATNKKFNISGITIYQFGNDNKINSIWRNWDHLGLLEQLGDVMAAHAMHH